MAMQPRTANHASRHRSTSPTDIDIYHDKTDSRHLDDLMDDEENDDSEMDNEHAGFDENSQFRDTKDVPVKSVEHQHAYKPSHSYDRSFSTTTAIHLDDHIGEPFDDEDGDSDDGDGVVADMDDEDGEDEEAKRALVQDWEDNDTIGATSRHVSETFSAMPEDLDFGPSVEEEEEEDRSHITQSARSKRHHTRIETARWTTSPIREHPQSNSSATRHSTPFRNPSSVRALQMSSPSPPPSFSQSPKSARYRRDVSSRHGTPSRRIGRFPSQQSMQSNSNKEYPLVLLHCSVSPMVLPYSSQTVQKVLPAVLQENIAILREKIGQTVMERGILIPHPGEDYELLEERVLENLDLKAPRLGKCGHFNGDDASEEAASTCEVCNNKMATDNSCRHRADPSRRKWDMRVYAANGLMRAGAWSAAWREMEKVDVELGIWLSEDLRRDLEREKEAESVEQLRQMSQAIESSSRQPTPTQAPPPQMASIPRQTTPEIPRRRKVVVEHARNGSTSGASSAPTAVKPAAAGKAPRRLPRERLPLSTLLANYAKRTLLNRPDILLQLFFFAGGAIYLSRIAASISSAAPATITSLPGFSDLSSPAAAMWESQISFPSIQSSGSAVASAAMWESQISFPSIQSSGSAVASAALLSLSSVVNDVKTAAEEVTSSNVPVCTFSSSSTSALPLSDSESTSSVSASASPQLRTHGLELDLQSTPGSMRSVAESVGKKAIPDAVSMVKSKKARNTHTEL